jgi:hypothetical protein
MLLAKIMPPLWWYSYSKIMVCLLLLNISLNYGQDPNIHDLACTQGAVAVTIVKHNYQKTLYISNLSTNEVMVVTESLKKLDTFPVCHFVSSFVDPCWQVQK